MNQSFDPWRHVDRKQPLYLLHYTAPQGCQTMYKYEVDESVVSCAETKSKNYYLLFLST